MARTGEPAGAEARAELLAWWNEQFESEATSFADLCDGVLYVQMLDALFPGAVELHRLELAPTTVDERARNLHVFNAAVRRLGVDVGGVIDVPRLARGDADAHAGLAHALRAHADSSALRLDAVQGYAALKARMEARALIGPMRSQANIASACGPGIISPVDGPKVSQRRDELDQLVECLKQEVAKRMQALEEQQSDFYEARHERGLLFSALQRVERICAQMVDEDPGDPLAGDLLAIVGDVPDDWQTAGDDDEYIDDGGEGGA
ncbi:hypothetical protein KFE25_005868 [Diacronema lutheri]|uniref:Calponin-homology (CH) domain-containing protein n=1 Tax=Diacronema lutheri TaxID=2081491 RepID=A0A8J5XK59_DIALT|nr:hypothetical protein KFE25_005868 [Diacronema lutheri]